MTNVKVLPPDPFILNCKMIYNDLGQIQNRIKRMWASATIDDDFVMLENIEKFLENIQLELQDRIDI